MSVTLEIDGIHVSGDIEGLCVKVLFADISLEIQPRLARELAYALTTEAGRVEEGAAVAGMSPCPTCDEYGCAELHGEPS